jgi:hypothetical protein
MEESYHALMAALGSLVPVAEVVAQRYWVSRQWVRRHEQGGFAGMGGSLALSEVASCPGGPDGVGTGGGEQPAHARSP